MHHTLRGLGWLLALLLVGVTGSQAVAQTVTYCPPPVVSYYAPPVVSYYAPPVVSYYAPPTVSYYVSPAVSYYAAPVYPTTVTTYQGILPWRRTTVTTYGAPAVVPAPVARSYYMPGYVIR